MKDITLDTTYKKIQHKISWFLFIVQINFIAWLFVIGLASYGKNTSHNIESKKGVLNKTWQKFIYIWGMIWTYILILIFVLYYLGI